MLDKFGSRFNFVIIYQCEAHAVDTWPIEDNDDDGVCFMTPRTMEERLNLASIMVQRCDVKSPVLVDLMTNEASNEYCAWPERLFVVNTRSKKLHFIGGPGPFWYSLEDLNGVLEKI